LSCFDDYITISENTGASRSGLYAADLPGIDVNMLDGIARNQDVTPSDDYNDIWAMVYKRAKNNLISDVTKNMGDKFFRDLKLITRETSSFKEDANTGSSLAGVTLEFALPKYAKLHIISIGVYSETSYSSGNLFTIHDTDENGELLATITGSISAHGRRTINVDQEFEADKIFISYDPATYSFRQTENKYYANTYTHFDTVVCDQCFYGDPDFRGSVVQVNGGGLNVKYMVYCSMEKFVCENLPLFKDAFLYKIGHEITIERRLGERLNEFTVMSKERWDELEGFYKAQYQQNVMNVIDSVNIPEDDLCFQCKNTVYTETLLP
jgi:hypothetical protein